MIKEHDWKAYYADLGVDRNIADKYIRYLRRFQKNKIPAIFEVAHLAELVGIEERYLYSMAFSTSTFYRKFKIRKRSGGFREISTPYPSLRQVQNWIKREILDKAPIHKTATGFAPKRDIIYNANIHCGKKNILKIDIKDFFPSISFDRVFSIFRKFGYPNNVSFMLARLCTLDGSTPQGAITSPNISNLVMMPFDAAMYRYSRKHRLKYTRYADDITVSADEISASNCHFFVRSISNFGFTVNENKYILLGEKDRKIVTGLDVTGDIVRLTRDYRRSLSKDIYYVWSAGLETHVARRKIFHPFYLEHLAGRVEFFRRVEPDNPQLHKISHRMKEIRSRIT